MRDLRRALTEGPKAIALSIVDFPHRHPFAISGFAGGLAIVLLIFAPGGLLDQQDQINVQKTAITKIGSICGAGSLKVGSGSAKQCAERMRIGLANCRREPTCLAQLEGLPIPVGGKLAHAPAGGVVTGGGSTNPSGQHGGGKPPSPGKGTGKGKHPSGGGGGQGAAPPPAPPPASPPAPPPEESPGKSGEAPGHTGENPGQGGGGPPGQEGTSPGQGGVVGGVEGVVEGVGKAVCSALEKVQGICSS